jgi:heavy metal sensor kinase
MLDSVRARLTLWYVAMLALVLITFSIGVYILLAHSLHHRLDEGLKGGVDEIARLLAIERAEGESESEAGKNAVTEPYFPGKAVAVFDTAGHRIGEQITPGQSQAQIPPPSMVPSETIQLYDLAGDASSNGIARRAAVQRVTVPPTATVYIIVVNQSLTEMLEELALLRRIFYIAVPVALMLAGLAGWYLARKSLAPVVVMAERARQIGAGNLGQQLPVVNPLDELGRLATAFNELLARLDAAFSQQRQFMADASHELRTPLYVIRTAVEVTMEQAHREEGEYRDALAIIGQQTRRLARIVEDMFTLARADAERPALHPGDFYLDELLMETVRAAQVLAGRKGVAVELEPAPEISYRGDEGLLRQMFLNLLDNAIKSTPAGGEVRVSLGQRDSSYEVVVDDTGTGIPVEAQVRIFERFYRVDQARTRNESPAEGGAGLGLSIARWIAEAHEGRLELRHSDERGSSFIATLPLS